MATNHQPRERSRRKNVEERGMYRARGNLSSREYIFLVETRVWLCNTIALRYANLSAVCVTARGQTRTCEPLECEINTATLFVRILGNSPIGFPLTTSPVVDFYL